MAQWANTNDSANAVNWVAESLNQGSGKTAIVANNTALFGNTTPQAFLNPHLNSSSDYARKQTVGQFAVEANQVSNTGGEGGKVTHAGFQIRRAGMGPITGATGAGSGYTNGAIVVITETGGNTAQGVLTTNSTGGVVSIAVSKGGLFSNTSGLTITNPNGAVNAVTIVLAGTGYNTGDVITISGGSTNAVFTIGANATGNVANVTSVTAGAGFGANNTTTKVVLAANGSATGNGMVSIAIGSAPAGGLGYNATDLVTFSNSTVVSTGNVAIAANGAIATLAVITTGSGFKGPTNTVITILTATGTPTGNGVSGFTINNGGSGYANGETVTVSNGTVNAVATIVTGVSDTIITSLTRTANGSGFKGAANSVVTITTVGGTLANLTPTFSSANIVPTFGGATFSTIADAGTNANVVITLGGRAGRVHYETLVSMGTIGHGAGSNNTQLPN